MDLNTAEGATRFLRSKTEPVSNITSTAKELLRGKNDLYLPNLKIFIFDVLCDRLNDDTSKQFKHWKHTADVWSLLIECWNSLSEDIQIRNNHFKKLKLVEVLISVFQHDSTTFDVLAPMFDFLKIVIEESYINVDEVSSIQLLTAYVSLLTKSFSAPDDAWTRIVYHIYQLPNLKVGQKFNKKTTSKFFTESLPFLLQFVHKEENRATVTGEILDQIITKTISNKDSHQYLSHNINLMIATTKKDIDCITYLFSIVVKQLSKSMDICEQVYLTITAKYSIAAEQLLAILTCANRTMSTQFLQNIYENEFKSTKDINWGLIGHLIDLDVDLAIDNSQIIMESLSLNPKYKSSKLSIGSKIVVAYFRAREFSKFVEELWPKFAWSEDEFIYEVSKHIVDLSTTQLNNLLLTLSTSTEFVTPRLTAIVKGLISCSQQKSSAVKQALLSSSFEKSISWEIRYYLLCLFGQEYVIKGENLIVSKTVSKYYFYSIFRMRELSVELADKLLNSAIPKYISFLEEANLKERVELLMTFLRRWVVIANKKFKKEELRQVITLVFKFINTKMLLEYFDKHGSLFFEQREVSESLVVILSERLPGSNTKALADNLKILALIPIQSIPKFLKVKLTDIVYETCINKKLASTESFQCLQHILLQPSFKSVVEVEFNSLLKLLSTSDIDNAKIAKTIGKSIWLQHLNTFQEQKSKEYVFGAVEQLRKFLKSSTKLLEEYDATVIIIETSHSSSIAEISEPLSSLIDEHLSSLVKILLKVYKTKNFHAINSLLNGLLEIPKAMFESKKDSIHPIIKDIGASIDIDNSSNEVCILKGNLFKLKTLCLAKDINSATYLISLLMALTKQTDSQLASTRKYFIEFLQSLDEECLLGVHSLLIHSLASEKDSHDTEVLMQILLCFLHNAVLSKENLSRNNSTTVLIQSLSIISSSIDRVTNTHATAIYIELLSSIKRCLVEANWGFNQYALEMTLSLVTKISQDFESKSSNIGDSEECYILLTQVVSHILLYHRYRLTSRHHLIISVCVSLMEPLSLKNSKKNGKNALNENKLLATSEPSAFAFSRLLGNLCEPPNTKESASHNSNALNSSSSLIKRQLRKHLPVLLVSFIYISLKSNFHSSIMESVLSGIFKVFDVLSQIELQLVSATLDIPSRTYYRSLYSNYKDNGKWKDS